jgi:drug/metabolite transporter (DMT)-like permease
MYLLLLFQQLIASSTHLVADTVTLIVQPTMVVGLRAVFACMFFGAYVMIRRGSLRSVRPEDRYRIWLLGMLNIPLNQLLFISGVDLSTAPNASLAYALTPAFVLLLSVIAYRQRPGGRQIIGMLLAMVGAAIVLVDRGANLSEGLMMGNMMVLGAAIAWSLYTMLGRDLATYYGGFHLTAMTMFTGAILYVPVWAVLYGVDIVPLDITPLLRTVDGITPMEIWGQIMYLGIITSGLGFGLWYVALTSLDAARLSVFNNLQPVLTTILAWVLLGTVPTPVFVVGGVVALAGVVLTQRR